jgi:hypothetical protein
MPEIWKKLTISPKLCYVGPYESDWLNFEERTV